MTLGLVGDLHGAFEALDRVMALEPAVSAWLSVGDVAGAAGEYPSPARPFYFIKGNNEDFDVIARLAAGPPEGNLRFLPNGVLVDVCGVRVAGLGGTFAPTWFETAPSDLPPAGVRGARDDKRRHLVRAEAQACAAIPHLDILLTHEAPRPYWAGTGRRRNDAGKAVINEVLAASRPRVHFFGHHHRYSEAVREGVPSIGLAPAGEGYVIVDTDGWTWTRREVSPEC
jgi:Icc-related predicted phosphoesterase